MPAVKLMLRICCRAIMALTMNRDASAWDIAMGMPHYSKKSMPAASFLQAQHVLQWVRRKRFTFYDYGNETTNEAVYGQVRAASRARCRAC